MSESELRERITKSPIFALYASAAESASKHCPGHECDLYVQIMDARAGMVYMTKDFEKLRNMRPDKTSRELIRSLLP